METLLIHLAKGIVGLMGASSLVLFDTKRQIDEIQLDVEIEGHEAGELQLKKKRVQPAKPLQEIPKAKK